MEKSGFTLRAVVVAVALTIFLVSTSTYIALRFGALPWPIIFSVIAAAALLKVLRKTNSHEINVAQAGGTIGGLVASGVAFTIPGIIFLQQKGVDINLPNPWVLAAICVVAGLLGVLLSIPVRKMFVEEEELPYPSGTAGAEVLKASEKTSKNTVYLLLALTLTGLFVLLRNIFFPGGWAIPFKPEIGLTVLLYPMPLAIGIGFILGKKASFNSWFSGSIIGWFVIIPLVVVFYSIELAKAEGMVKDLGMGLVMGSGVGFFVSYILPRFKKIFSPLFNMKNPWYLKSAPLLSVVAIIVLSVVGIPVGASIIAVVGTWIMVTVAARMTGETNIDPLEQFGIIIGLIAIGIFALVNSPLGHLPAFLIVCFVAVACAVAGDIGHDYKSAKIIGTRFQDIVKVDLIAVVAAGLLAPFILKVIIEGYESSFFTAAMPAPQAQLVAGSIFGFANPVVFSIGFGIAFVWIILEAVSKKQAPIMPMLFGIGLFLGPTLGILLAIGGIIRWWTDAKWPALYTPGLIISAGIMGGEGIAGFGSAALFIAGGPKLVLIMFAFFGVLLLAILPFLRKWYSREEN